MPRSLHVSLFFLSGFDYIFYRGVDYIQVSVIADGKDPTEYLFAFA